MISLVTIVLNEAQRLPTMIRSAQPIVDEFIIVDTGSTDGTIELAHNLGCKVIEWGPSDNFSQPRNYGLDIAKGDWILHLDADDQLTPLGRLEIPALTLEHEANKLTGYCFTIKEECASPFLAPSSGRLWLNKEYLRYKGRVHMQIKDKLHGKERWCLVNGGPHIIHTGYSDPVILQEKLKRNLRLLQLDDLEDPDIQYYLAITYKDLGYESDADYWARSALSTERPPWVKSTLETCLIGKELKVQWVMTPRQ